MNSVFKAGTSFLFSLFLFSLFSGSARKQDSNARKIVFSMLERTAKVKSIKYHMARFERYEGKYMRGELDAKVQMNPRKIYLKNSFPETGAEVLWAEGWNDNKAHVHPNKFPWINLNFDPRGSTLMANQHHSIHEIGYSFFTMIIKDALNKHGEDFDKYVFFKGQFKILDRPAYLIEINFTEYKWGTYTVQGNETLFDLEKKLVVPAYLVKERNNLNAFDGLVPGQVLKVPNTYAKKSYVYIDIEKNVPIVMEVWDELGMFERYEYRNLQVDPVISDSEFTPDFPEYGF